MLHPNDNMRVAKQVRVAVSRSLRARVAAVNSTLDTFGHLGDDPQEFKAILHINPVIL